ncbi:glutathione S-transferase [Marinicauda pacifica]|uniref:Glutathione S-transferase n=1 Tax=Marinicauda pacifica TaxID=1133559 RepID=A0A4S2HEA9_9PROT|nr:glutathione S-transferase [Marinicauda pacifica]TGY94400.1 glutathione S-transferase [Marinicauda pacifica]GGE35523.1 glutathione S-transferase [Marinicauda pacifica]
MRLYYSSTSPYARKCRALIIEKGLEGKVECVEASPLDNPAELYAANPLGKVPTLSREKAPAIIGSAHICEFLDTLNDELWIPSRGESRVLVMRQQAIADGLLDLTMGRRIEVQRDEGLRWDFWQARWEAAIARTIETLEAERGQFDRSVDLGALAIAISLGYLDLRYSEFDWRARAPGLAKFAQTWFARESFAATAPPAG